MTWAGPALVCALACSGLVSRGLCSGEIYISGVMLALAVNFYFILFIFYFSYFSYFFV